MNIQVLRDISTARSVESQISLTNNEPIPFICYGLEPAWDRTETVKPRAIPPGKYNVTRRFSPKHQRIVPLVENVPGFEDIEIHWGNFEFEHLGSDGKFHPPDSLGCLIVGKTRSLDAVLTSKPVFDTLDLCIKNALEKGEKVTITYINNWN